jgi:cytoskeleton protein RodZ
MQNIGEQLEEARKRKGISLREASEATKIRSDFLSNIEKNQFDFELPEIYKRGFVKNYANYLGLDANSILSDYDAQLLDASNSGRKTAGSELFGSMDLKSRTKEEENRKKSQLGKISARSNASEKYREDAHEDEEVEKSFYVKVGLVVLGVFAFLVVIIGLIISVLGGGDDESETTVANTRTPPPVASSDRGLPADPSPETSPERVSLIASGNVYVLVKQRNDNKELVRRTLGEGETLGFTKEGPVDILFTAGENLIIVNPAGERLRPKGEGTAKISIP